jgi:hypothetical protein
MSSVLFRYGVGRYNVNTYAKEYVYTVAEPEPTGEWTERPDLNKEIWTKRPDNNPETWTGN